MVDFKDYLGTMCLNAAYKVKPAELENIAPYKLANLLFETVAYEIDRNDQYRVQCDLEEHCDDFRDKLIEIIIKFYNII